MNNVKIVGGVINTTKKERKRKMQMP